MIEPTSRFWQLFLELFESLPRQGPGNRACTERALGLCDGLPPFPKVADLGCGVGGQTLHLAAMTRGTIVAVDLHEPSISNLRETVSSLGLSERIFPMVADMADTGLLPGSFDLVWSEGALYSIGMERALSVSRELLRPGGFLAFTDAVWLRDDPPSEVKESFDLDYPSMGRTADILALLEQTGFSPAGHFTLPDEAWWMDFYTPMEKRIAEMRKQYEADEKALAVLDRLALEPEMRRKYPEYFAYEFFTARRRD